MDPHAFLRTRRSIRRFTPEPIPDAALERMFATAACAPSAHDRQPWRFCAVRSAEARSRLADAMAADFRRDLAQDDLPAEEVAARVARSRSRIQESPVVIVLCMDLSDMDVYPDRRRQEAERVMAIQSTAAAGLQLLLAAHAEGLAGVWTCGPLFAPDTVRTALGLAAAWEPQAMFLIGHPAREPKARQSRPLEDIVKWS